MIESRPNTQVAVARSTSRQIIKAIGDISFRSINLAPAVEAALFLHFLSAEPKLPPSIFARWASHPVVHLMRRFIQITRSSTKDSFDSADVLFDVYSNDYRTSEPIIGLAKLFAGRAIVRVPGVNLGSTKDGIREVADSEINVNAWAWVRAVILRLSEWREIVLGGISSAGVSKGHLNFILSKMIVAALQVARMEELWGLTRPRCVIVASDHHITGAILCAIARREGRPSVTLQHGLLDRETLYLSVPVIADHYFAWGQYDANLVQKYGETNPQIHLIGTPLFDAEKEIDSEYLSAKRRSLVTAEKKHVVVFALNSALSMEETKNVIKLFEDTVQSVEGWTGLIRPHPANTKADIESIAGDLNNITIVENGALSARETIELSDAIITQQTTFGIEVVFHGGNLIGLDIPHGSLGYIEDLATESGAAYMARTSEDLGRCLKSISQNDQEYKNIIESADAAVSKFLARSGESSNVAAARALNTILNAQQ